MLNYQDIIMSPNVKVTKKLFDYWFDKIDKATELEIAILCLFAPGGHIAFNNRYGIYLKVDQKFNMDFNISKKIDHDKLTKERFLEIMSK